MDVPMSGYVCTWCGAPYYVPTAITNNSAVIKHCPSGHSYGSSVTLAESLAAAHREMDTLREAAMEQKRTIANLRGQITKLKAAKS